MRSTQEQPQSVRFAVSCRTSSDIRIVNYGLDLVEVRDNGSGIREEDFDTIGKLTFSVLTGSREKCNIEDQRLRRYP